MIELPEGTVIHVQKAFLPERRWWRHPIRWWRWKKLERDVARALREVPLADEINRKIERAILNGEAGD